jgi:hypothetical protein
VAQVANKSTGKGIDMNRQTLMAAAIAAAMMAMTVSLFADEQPVSPRKSEPISGYHMMSETERNDYRQRMRDAKSADERQTIRDEHHKLMQQRAKELSNATHDHAAGSGPRQGPMGGPHEGMGSGNPKGK